MQDKEKKFCFSNKIDYFCVMKNRYVEGINNAALVLFSGGQDSTVCLFWALKNFDKVEAICFQYGQRHSVEIEAAKEIAQNAGVRLDVVDASMISDLARSSLTNEAVVMDTELPQNAKLPNTFVPGRNMFFITIAAVVARERNIKNIVAGVSQADYSGYPDCRDAFIRSLNATLNLAMEEQFVIHTPLMWLDKAAIWRLADELAIFEIVKNNTVTCYNGIRGAGCGECLSCNLRKKGLLEYEKVKL